MRMILIRVIAPVGQRRYYHCITYVLSCQQLFSVLCSIGNPRGARVSDAERRVKRFIFYLLLTAPGPRARKYDLLRGVGIMV